MTETLKMNYAGMAQMQRLLQNAASEVQGLSSDVKNIAGSLESGVLLGQAGSAFADKLKGRLVHSLDGLASKYQELAGEVGGAMQDMQQADQSSTGGF
jgi:WXG100 family type VII secretion target